MLENYNECYHCAGVHPELVRLVPAFGRGGSDLDWDRGIPHREGAWTFTARAPPPARRSRGSTRRSRCGTRASCSTQPDAEPLGRPRRGVHALADVGRAHTRIVCDLLFAPDEVGSGRFDPSDAADFWDVVNKQDWAICESVQRGMSSRGFTQGWFAPMEDASLDIRRWLLPRLGEPS